MGVEEEVGSRCDDQFGVGVVSSPVRDRQVEMERDPLEMEMEREMEMEEIRVALGTSTWVI